MHTNKSVGALLLIFCLPLMLHAQQKQFKVINIGFYNLENFFDTIHQEHVDDYEFLPTSKKKYTSEVYQTKVTNMASVIADMGTSVSPDGIAILGVSEVENQGVLENLVAQPALQKRHYGIVHYESPDARGIDVGLLYNPRYFTVISSKPLHVSLKPDADGSVHQTRDVLWVTGKLDGEIYHIFVNHWPSRRGGETASSNGRSIAAGVSRKVIDSLLAVDPNTNVIVMGDLNDNPTNESVTKVLRAKGDADNLKPGELYNPWVSFYNKGIGTLAYQDSWSLFDQIMMTQHLLDKTDVHYHFYKANIFKRDDMMQTTGKYKGYPKRTYDFDNFMGGFSDHFPTFITLIKAAN
jgi:endonuclease/exonuclease/phosphatase family metal-dependent hydrolase